jgi:hypothetical protein
LVTPARFERATSTLGGWRSIQLSYEAWLLRIASRCRRPQDLRLVASRAMNNRESAFDPKRKSRSDVEVTKTDVRLARKAVRSVERTMDIALQRIGAVARLPLIILLTLGMLRRKNRNGTHFKRDHPSAECQFRQCLTSRQRCYRVPLRASQFFAATISGSMPAATSSSRVRTAISGSTPRSG